MDDEELYRLAARVGEDLKRQGLMLAAAESCTGGWIGAAITAIPGSSDWFDRGFITYSNDSKREMLSVQAPTLSQFGAVSEETAREMATGALKHSRAQVAVSVTGVAGPSGGSKEKPVGTVCFAWTLQERVLRSRTHHLVGDRASVRRQSVVIALQGVLAVIAGGDTALA